MLAHTLYVVWAAGADVHGELKAANPERKAALAPLSNIYTARWRVVRGLAAAMTLTALVLHLSRYRPTPVATPKMWELAAFHPKPAPPEMDGGGMDFWDGKRELSFMAHLMDDSHVAPMVRLVILVFYPLRREKGLEAQAKGREKGCAHLHSPGSPQTSRFCEVSRLGRGRENLPSTPV